MKIQITSINFQHVGQEVTGVQIVFNTVDNEHRTNLNGFIHLTMEDYMANKALDKLEELVRKDVIERLQKGSETI